MAVGTAVGSVVGTTVRSVVGSDGGVTVGVGPGVGSATHVGSVDVGSVLEYGLDVGSRGVCRSSNQHHDDGDQIAAGFERIVEAVAELLGQLPTLDPAPDDREDVETVAGELLAEVRQAEPEPRKIRRAMAALRGLVAPITAGKRVGDTGIEPVTSSV